MGLSGLQKIFMLTLVTVFFQHYCYASIHSDSLIQALPTANDSTKLELYNQLSVNYYYDDIHKARHFDSLGLILAQKIGNLTQEGRFYNNLGIDYYVDSDLQQSHFFFSQARNTFVEIKDTAYLVMALNNLGAVYKWLGFYKLSASHYAEAINLRHKNHDTTSLVTTYNNIAVLYDKIGLTDEGLSYLKEAVQLSLQLNDTSLLSLTYLNLGILKKSKGNFQQAIEFSEQALSLANPLQLDGIISIYNNLALVYQKIGENKKAAHYFQRAIDMFSKDINEWDKAITLQNYTEFLADQGQYDKALTIGNQALAITEKHQLSETQSLICKSLANIYQSKKEFDKAYFFLTEYNRLNDSIYNSHLAASLMLINVNERIIQAKHDRLLLEKQNQIQSDRIGYSTKLINFMISASVVLLLFLAIIIYYVVRKKKDNLQLKQLNKQLSSSEEKYKAVVEQSSQVMLIHQNGKLLFANQHFYNLSGYAPEELATLSIFEFVHPEEQEKIIQMANNRMKGQPLLNSYELKAFNKSNEEVYLNMSFSKITYNDQPAILGVGIDISDRKKNLETIKKLTAAIEQSPVMVLITDKKGNVEYANPAFTQITGYSMEEILGENPRMLSSGQNNVHIYKELWKTILGGDNWRGDLLNKKKNGEYYWESLVISPILNEQNNITHFVAIMEDVSKRKSINEELIQREEALHHANVTKDKFFSIIAHDLKNPFNAIIGFTSLLMAEYENINDEERRNYIENISLASNTTYRLLENLLEWSRTQTGKIKFTPTLVDINSIINEVINLQQTQASKKGLRIISEIPFNTLVFADKNMIRTVLRNLISNAIKFTSTGEIRISSKKKKESLEVCVSDTGIGIPEDGINKLFRLDEQYLAEGTEFEKGTGIGLILSKEFISRHGGNIWVKSKKNMGAKFYFTLPTHKTQFN